MVVPWGLVIALAVFLAWAKWTQSRAVYRSLWIVAAGIMLLIGLVL